MAFNLYRELKETLRPSFTKYSATIKHTARIKHVDLMAVVTRLGLLNYWEERGP
jgi:hypothetical protein